MCVCIYTFARLEEIDDDENGDDDDGDDDAVQYIPMCVGEEKIVKPEFRRQDKKKTNSFFFHVDVIFIGLCMILTVSVCVKVYRYRRDCRVVPVILIKYFYIFMSILKFSIR